MHALLRDHANYPFSICRHPDSQEQPLDQGATIASVILNLEDETRWLADGLPCAMPYRQLDCGELFAESR